MSTFRSFTRTMSKKIPFPVSLDEQLVERIKAAVEKGRFRNRSHVVEQAILDFKKRRESNEH